MARDRALLALAALAFFPCALAYFNIKDDRTRYSILVSAVISALGFMATKAAIPLIKARTLRAGLHGKDINKKGSEAGEKDIPESLGLAPGVVFLVNINNCFNGGDQVPAMMQLSHQSYIYKYIICITHSIIFLYADLHHSFPAIALLRRCFWNSWTDQRQWKVLISSVKKYRISTRNRCLVGRL